MKLSLRKANGIQNEITSIMSSIPMELVIELNEFEEVVEQIDTAKTQFQINSKRWLDLAKALYEIRKDVAMTNATCGISDVLTEVAFYEKQIAKLSSYVAAGSTTNLRVLNGKVQKNSTTKDDGYVFSNSRPVTTSILSDEQVEGYKDIVANLKRQKRKKQERLLEMNLENEIELTESTLDTLTKEGLI